MNRTTIPSRARTLPSQPPQSGLALRCSRGACGPTASLRRRTLPVVRVPWRRRAPAWRDMAGELQQLTPTADHFQAAQAAARSGLVDAGDMSTYVEALAASDWAQSNAWRLDAGESVAWAGQQTGYAEAADTDGQLLEWLPESDEHVCEDCGSLGDLPPMPLSDWPTTPGAGDTDCNVGCRCVLQVADEQLGPNGEPPALSQAQEDLVSRIAQGREPTSYRESQRDPASPAALSPDQLAAVRRSLAGMSGR